jgi:hypothetical protein
MYSEAINNIIPNARPAAGVLCGAIHTVPRIVKKVEVFMG